MTHPTLRGSVAILALLALTACEDLDFDLRGNTGGFTTSEAAQQATAARPNPDDRGIISYPNYQVAVARRGDTVQDVATRIGANADELAKFNGLPLETTLRAGEIIALPGRVPEPSPATGAIGTGPIRPAGQIDVTTLAGQAIDTAPQTAQTAPAASAPKPQTGAEPIRHKVVRGETAYSVARLYNVPVRSLARWNSLGPQYAIREGQYLLIPVAEATPPSAAPVATPITETTAPGEGSPTPTPPSAQKPLPEDDTPPAAEPKPEPPKPDLGAATKPVASGQLAYPVQGSIIRDYAKGRNEGINIKGSPGTSVKAAEAGTVAAITESADGVPIIVVRHKDNLLTVYANVTDVSVKKGDQVRRGQGLAKLRQGDQSFVHFEVRKGFDSVDPNDYLN